MKEAGLFIQLLFYKKKEIDPFVKWGTTYTIWSVSFTSFSFV